MLKTYYRRYNWVHTNNNLAIVLIALLYGWPDYEKVVCISVMQGMDTDCNGATAGSIIGAAARGEEAAGEVDQAVGWSAGHERQGFMQPKIADLAQRTIKQIERVLAQGWEAGLRAGLAQHS